MRIFLFCIFLTLWHRETNAQTAPGDSLALPDTAAVSFIRPIPGIGSLIRGGSNDLLADSAINFSNYRYIGDLLETRIGFFNRDFGSLGPTPDINIFGLDNNNLAYLADGIELNEPFTWKFNPYLFPAENLEQIEIIIGTKAFLFGLNGTGAAINFITKNKKAVRPYSRIRYSESGYGFGIIDGMVSQDVIRGLNITAGTQHTVYGQRYINENYDAWDARIKIRYNLDERINFFASERYNQSLCGIWQGVDIYQTADSVRYEVLQATVRNTDAYEKVTRHDLQFGSAARIFPDTNDITTLTFFYSSSVRQYRDLENDPTPNGIFRDDKSVSSWFGAKLTQNLSLGTSDLNIGAQTRGQTILNTPSSFKRSFINSSVYAIASDTIAAGLSASVYARGDFIQAKTYMGYGADLRFNLSPVLSFYGGYSRSNRFASARQMEGTDTIITSALDAGPERHHLVELGATLLLADYLKFDLRSFNRIIWNSVAIEKYPDGATSPFGYGRLSKKNLRGISAALQADLWVLSFEGTGSYTEIFNNSELKSEFPRWTAAAGLYYRNKILGEKLDLKSGLRGRYFTGYSSDEFNFEAGEYLPSGYGFEIPPTGVLDLVILAHLGKAYIHLIWDNVLNKKYIMNSFYPMPERQMRFGVSWEFLD